MFIGTIPNDNLLLGNPVVDIAVYPFTGSPVIEFPNQVTATGIDAVVTVVPVVLLIYTK